MKKLTVITGNAGKAEQIGKYLGISVDRKDIDFAEIQSLDLVEVVEDKARRAYEIVKSPVIVDDNSLVINALGKLPGPLVRYFLKELGNQGICDLVTGKKDKTASADVAICYFDGKEMKTFVGTIKGSIAKHPAGENGFGWDAIFIPDGYTKTRAELTNDEYDKVEINPRKIALGNFASFYKSLN